MSARGIRYQEVRLPDSPGSPPDEADRRIIRPRPGGRTPGGAPPMPTAAPAGPVVASPVEALQTLVAGVPAAASGPGLIGPAMPLLQLLARLRSMASQPDPAELRRRTELELERFEQRAQLEGVPADQIRRAHYALCASLDDSVLNTPWGSRGAWAEKPLVAVFHKAVGADRFFDAMRHAEANVASFRAALEVMYLCLSLGFLGSLRGRPDAATEIEARRAAAAAILTAQLPPVHVRLSADWKGVSAPYVPRRTRLPLWVACSLGLAVTAGLFLLITLSLNEQSDAVFTQLLDLPPSHMPLLARAALPPPPAPADEPALQDRLRSRLQQEVAGHRLVVGGTAAMPILRIPARLLFAADNARLQAQAAPLLQEVAEALQPEEGRVRVVGYSDDRPVHTILFPSSFQLSAARADAVRAGLAQTLGDPSRVISEGRAGAEPVASNATADGRDQNRRIEIVLDQTRS